MESTISIISHASDRYGSPYLLGFMEEYHLSGLIEATEEQAEEYAIKTGLLPEKHGGKTICLLSSTGMAMAK